MDLKERKEQGKEKRERKADSMDEKSARIW